MTANNDGNVAQSILKQERRCKTILMELYDRGIINLDEGTKTFSLSEWWHGFLLKYDEWLASEDTDQSIEDLLAPAVPIPLEDEPAEVAAA